MAQKKSSLLLSWLNSAKRKLSPNWQAQILQKQIKPGFRMTYLEPSQCPSEMKKKLDQAWFPSRQISTFVQIKK